MRRIATALLAALALLGPGCGGDEEKLDYPAREVKMPDLSAAGSVSGSVFFLGDPPPRRRLATACTGHDSVPDETLVVADGRIADVLIYLSEGTEGWVFPWEKNEAAIDQEGCRFVPHVLAIRAGQPIRIRNSDPMAHNLNMGARRQPGFVVSFAGPGEAVRQLMKPELSIRATCDLHANMLMHVHVLDHPWFAVTGPDGRFEIAGIPPGRYRLAARHAELGEQSRSLVITENGKVENFDFQYAR